MNNREAINLIRHSKPVDNNAYCLMLNEAFDIAIQAIGELEQYKAREEFFSVSYNGYPNGQYEEYLQYKSLGTLEQVREAVDRMKAKKPRRVDVKPYMRKHFANRYTCPGCNTEVSPRDCFCRKCGQAIDFGNETVSAEDS